MTSVRKIRTPERVVTHSDGTRHCAWCGDYIDPIDWCPDCQTKQAPCGTHRRLRKRVDAAYCDAECRWADHNDRKRVQRDGY